MKQQEIGLNKYSLSEGQKGLWILQQFNPEISSFNIPICLKIKSNLQITHLSAALDFLIKQYPILSTILSGENGEVVQQLSKQTVIVSEEKLPLDENERIDHLKEISKRPFDMDKGLIKCFLFPLKNDECILLLTIHHLVMDGSSYLPIIKTLLDAYCLIEAGKKPVSSENKTSYADFVSWQQNYLKSIEGKQAQAYWKEQLQGTLPVIELPFDNPRVISPTFQGSTVSVKLSIEKVKALLKSTNKLAINRSVLFLGLYKILLSRINKQDDLIIGVPFIGRTEEMFDDLIGYCINMLPVRSKNFKSSSFEQFLKELQYTVIDAVDNGNYPFQTMVREVKVNRDQNVTPVFQVAFAYHNFLQESSLEKLEQHYSSKLPFHFLQEIHQEGEFELELEIMEGEKEYQLLFKYHTELFNKDTIQLLSEQYLGLIDKVTNEPTIGIDRLYELLPTEEDKISKWNATFQEYEKDKCVHELFDEMAHAYPNAIAVRAGDKKITYKELKTKSDILARYLGALDIDQSLIGICTKRSLELAIGLLGILKANKVYVPLDPSFPAERLKFMCEDSEIGLLISESALLDKISTITASTNVLLLDTDWKTIDNSIKKDDAPLTKTSASQLAYVIYTSGSTGKPKGVMVGHQGLTNFLLSMAKEPGFEKDDRLLSVTSYSFDIFGLELFLPLIKGGECILCDEEICRDADQLKEFIAQTKPSVMQATPVTWNMLLCVGWTNNEQIKILCGGEALTEKLKNQLLKNDGDVWNMFGPTETTIWSTVKKVNAKEMVSIGHAIANTEILIVDEDNKLAPIGAKGELCIAGDGLAQGYWKRGELTEQKFQNFPSSNFKKIYRTGDIASWRASGELNFFGRIDFQLKIRGYRVELGEIEKRLNEWQEVEEAIVVVQENNSSKQLIAYLKNKKGSTLQLDLIKAFLMESLPDYMIPAHFEIIQAFPLTPNGKIDRNSIAAKKIESKKNSVSAANLPIEKRLLVIWQQELNNDDIAVDERFFDIGGNSLLAVNVTNRIKTELDCPIKVTHLFKYNTIEQLAEFVEKNSRSTTADLAANKHHLEEKTSISAGTDLPDYYANSIAIIGISCQFPGAKDHREFWDNLISGKESLRFFSKDELSEMNIPKDIKERENFIAVQSTIQDKNTFDPEFFGISPKDTEFMDPQFRILLMNAWKAVEDAGYDCKKILDTSVFMSASNSYYQAMLPNFSSPSLKILKNSDEYVSWLLAQGGTIPTMISHKLGFTGPSYFVHSNCSSSLVGMHSAFQMIITGESKYALVGASTISPANSVGYLYQQGLNFSSDGHLKFSDKSADGMIGGEGAGVILLKRADEALRDGDNIYAIIRGVGVNNDGADKVGFYAPSVKGQADVIQKVLQKTAIHPETISYVEAHGTGTQLGDPVELTALTDAYRQHTIKNQYCGIGSVKTNIGHLDTAAGLAGCIKIALSLYKKEIPTSLHFEQPNPAMELENSPFFVTDRNLKLADRTVPHRAALSSFGIGGTNTHAILEQLPERWIVKKNDLSFKKLLFPLSAQNTSQLLEYAKSLITFLMLLPADQKSNAELERISYTLQVGRTQMKNRMIVVAGFVDELLNTLQAFVNNERSAELWNAVPMSKKMFAEWKQAYPDPKEKIRDWWRNGQTADIAGYWSKGGDIEWEELYVTNPVRRISLPTYPFEKKEIAGIVFNDECETKVDKNIRQTFIHPLVQKNTSDAKGVQFSSRFDGSEFFLADHQIMGQGVLPGVAYLEMGRAAFQQLHLPKEKDVLVLTDIVWMKPVSAPSALEVKIEIKEKQDECYEYKIEQVNEHAPGFSNGQGVIRYTQRTGRHVDLDAIRKECNIKVIDRSECYAAFDKLGMCYGVGHRGLSKVYIGKEEALAKIELPLSLMDQFSEFVLHPCLLDTAIQSSAILMMHEASQEKTAEVKTALPFSLKELVVFKPCEKQMWSHVKYCAGSSFKSKVRKLDIDLYNDRGALCISFKEYASMMLNTESKPAVESDLILLQPSWNSKEANPLQEQEYQRNIVLIINGDQQEIDELKAARPQTEVEAIQLAKDQYEELARITFRKLKEIILSKPKGKVVFQIILTTIADQLYEGISGMLKTVRLENPKILAQVIGNYGSKSLTALVNENINNTEDHYVIYSPDRKVREWVLTEKILIPQKNWKPNGVYLITGGSGAIGKLFANEILKSEPSAKVILCGRTPIAELQKNKLYGNNSAIFYKSADVSKAEDVSNLIREIQKEHGKLSGIIHSAGIIKDNFIIKKSEDELVAVLEAKLKGLRHLDEASQDIALDFLILFSSGVAVLGNPGQADYAAANAYMDVFAKQRNVLKLKGIRKGHTLSINWPLWKEGGMQVSESVRNNMKKTVGMIPMSTANGLHAFYTAFMQRVDQLLVLEGEKENLLKSFQLLRSIPSKQISTPTSMEPSFLKKTLELFVRNTLSEIVKVEADKIEPEVSFEKYGIDSIQQLSIIQKLETVTGELSKTILFEYSSLEELLDYLWEGHQENLVLNFGDKQEEVEHAYQEDAIHDTNEITDTKMIRKEENNIIRNDHINVNAYNQDIAIIGIAGRFPGADSLTELWDNLCSATNSITQVPIDRWKSGIEHLNDCNQEDKTQRFTGGFLDQIDRFDFELFGIKKEQVKGFAPEVRLFLETVWQTFEDGGYNLKSLSQLQKESGKGIGVYVGCMYNQYAWSIPDIELAKFTTNGTDWQIANRISHFFDLKGPSMAVNTACSSSLSAIHLAYESLKSNSSIMAIAGGVNLTLDPSKYDSLSSINFLGTGFESKSFGQGTGYIPGEGVGAVLLKTVQQAEKDGDHIYGIIKGSTLNHCGGRQVYSAPDPKQQTALIEQSLNNSGIPPHSINYIEAAANGSPLGDPIEIVALKNTFGKHLLSEQSCALGTVKSNIGHLEAASGISQLSKVILQLKYRKLVPSINSIPRNKNIKLEKGPFYIQEELSDWKPVWDSKNDTLFPLRCMINSFGAGGTYANLIIEEYDQKKTSIHKINKPFLHTFSAASAGSLRSYLEKIVHFVKTEKPEINDLAFSLNKINHGMKERLAIVAADTNHLMQLIHQFLSTEKGNTTTLIYNKSDDLSRLTVNSENEQFLPLIKSWMEDKVYTIAASADQPTGRWIPLPSYVFDHTSSFDFEIAKKSMQKQIGQGPADTLYLELAKKILNDNISEQEAMSLFIKQ